MESVENKIEASMNQICQEIENLEEKLVEIKFNLELSHANLILNIDSNIMKKLESLTQSCDKCLLSEMIKKRFEFCLALLALQIYVLNALDLTDMFSEPVTINRCENQNLDMVCPNGQNVYVKSVKVALNSDKCFVKTNSFKCSQDAYKIKARNVSLLCRNKQTCRLNVSSQIFGKECDGDVRYISIDYSCTTYLFDMDDSLDIGRNNGSLSTASSTTLAPYSSSNGKDDSSKTSSNPIQVSGCEDAELNITCNPGRYVFIQSVQVTLNSDFCGRKTSIFKCSKEVYTIRSQDFSKFCKNKENCRVKVGENIFGTLCNGDIRYIQISYLCNRYQVNENNQFIIPAEEPINLGNLDFNGMKLNLTEEDILKLNMHSRAEVKNLFRIASTKTTSPCELQNLNLTCSANQKIFIDTLYMHIDRCKRTNTNKEKCKFMITDELITAIKKNCINKQNCFLPLNKNELFGEKCSLNKGIYVRFFCLQELFTDLLVSNTCENNHMTLQCDVNQRVLVSNAKFGRWESSVCPSLNSSNKLCSGLDVTNLVTNECANKRRCSLHVNEEFLGKICPGVRKYLEVKYKCVQRIPMTNPCADNPCGLGALCRNVGGFATCSCPAGSTGDPKSRCCKNLNCNCWGDPHCNTFDKAKFDFMGRCKYDLVTTDCFNQTLPNGLIPFSVSQKQETRHGKTNVAYIQYIDVNVYNRQYRLLKKQNGKHVYTIDGILSPNDYQDKQNGIKIYLSAGNLVLSTQFGLTVTWNGDHKVDVNLCNTYSNYVCGLCGNADGSISNDFVDRRNNLRDIDQILYNNTIFKWASKWRISDDSIDFDGTKCNPANDPGPVPPIVKCKKEALYESDQYCGIITSLNGPWGKCLKQLDKNVLAGIYDGCLFDMCATENDQILQADYRCKAYEEITDACINLLDSIINWRTVTGCPKKCGLNEVYTVRTECPKTCLDPTGKNDCGEIKTIEGCFCNDNYILNSFGVCVSSNECGCKFPDNSGVLALGQSLKINCTVGFTCNRLTGKIDVQVFDDCSENAVCMAGQNNEPQCRCTEGFIGNGFDCVPGTLPPTSTITSTTEFYVDLLDGSFTEMTTEPTTSTTSPITPMPTTTNKPTTSTTTLITTEPTTTTTSTTITTTRFKIEEMNLETKSFSSKQSPTTMSINNTSLNSITTAEILTEGQTTSYQVTESDQCYQEFVIDTVQNKTEYLNTFVEGTSSCGLSDKPFYFEDLLDMEFQECENEKTCYGFGDPHYRTFDGAKFSINKTCPYILATDYCPGSNKFTYLIYVDHENRYSNEKAIFIKSITVYFNRKFYQITKDLFVNSVRVFLPYNSERDNVYVTKEGLYTIFRTNFFSVYFDGDELLKFRECGSSVCGLCGNNNENVFDDFEIFSYQVQDLKRECFLGP
ncbi:unnamed protein product [Brachionus calyciflorus]|uniref:Zonadhesin-like n=1 Tax=Brachionus calyciflorus TaxID=104777 RepID=A0A814CM59_9BILA|nr:unnamed protein product [Brachionus calyciflorus]